MKGGAIDRLKATMGYRQAQPAECCSKCALKVPLTPATARVYRWPLYCGLASFGVTRWGVCDRFTPKADTVTEPAARTDFSTPGGACPAVRGMSGTARK